MSPLRGFGLYSIHFPWVDTHGYVIPPLRG
jgi:hypothetical protein